MVKIRYEQNDIDVNIDRCDMNTIFKENTLRFWNEFWTLITSHSFKKERHWRK